MAKLDFQQTELVLTLSPLEKLFSFNGGYRMPLSNIVGAEILTGRWGYTLGWRVPGTYLPFLVVAGTYLRRKNKAFAVWHAGQQVLQINLNGGFYNRVIVGVDDAQHWVDEITMMITSC